MKDSIARDEARKALSREAVLRDAVAEWRAEENRRLWKLEEGLGYVEKDCPVCGHVTLMKKQAALVEYDPEASNDGLLLARYKTVRPEGFYCYSCGGTFRESTKAVLEEVKEGKE